MALISNHLIITYFCSFKNDVSLLPLFELQNGTSPKLAPDVNLEEIASSDECSGFTGADLAALVREAGVLALKDIFCGQTVIDSVMITPDHFKRAFAKIRPSVPEKVFYSHYIYFLHVWYNVFF